MPHIFVDSNPIQDKISGKKAEVHEKNVQARVSLVAPTYGFINYTASGNNEIKTTKPGQIFFYQMDLIGTHPSEIEVGDVVQFDVVKDRQSGFYVAKEIYLVSKKDEIVESEEKQTWGDYFKSFFGSKKSNV